MSHIQTQISSTVLIPIAILKVAHKVLKLTLNLATPRQAIIKHKQVPVDLKAVVKQSQGAMEKLIQWALFSLDMLILREVKVELKPSLETTVKYIIPDLLFQDICKEVVLRVLHPQLLQHHQVLHLHQDISAHQDPHFLQEQ